MVRSPFFILQLSLMGFGLIQVLSSSFIFAQEQMGFAQFYFIKQLLFVFLGLLATLLVSQCPLDSLKNWSWVLWPLMVFLMLLTLLPGVGIKAGGASRWLAFPGGFRFEPGEFLKLASVFWMASLFQGAEISSFRFWGFRWKALLTGAGLVVLFFQPDFGSLVIILAIWSLVLFVMGLRVKWLVIGASLLTSGLGLLMLLAPYRQQRWLAFLDPWVDPQGRGYQVIQSMMTFSQGGFWGEGLGQGQGKLFFLPEAHTDFTFAVLGEEWGLIGVFLLISLYFGLLWQSWQVVQRQVDPFFKIVGLGLLSLFALSALINMSMVLGLLPTKGLTLPFLSYGGSSTLMLSLLIGVFIRLEKG